GAGRVPVLPAPTGPAAGPSAVVPVTWWGGHSCLPSFKGRSSCLLHQQRGKNREPDARRLPALLALRAVAPRRVAAVGVGLLARLARPEPPRPGALAQRASGSVPRRAGGGPPG